MKSSQRTNIGSLHPRIGGRCDGCGGFSLVEVTLAIGIVSFAVLAMVGLSATSHQVLQQAQKEELGRNIHRSISGQLLSSAFEELPGASQTVGFDENGFPVQSQEQIVYQARITSRPGSSISGNPLDQTAARIFSVEIFHAPGTADLSSNRRIMTSPLVVARTGKADG